LTEYCPDNWVVIRLVGDKVHYRVLGGWFGGYLSGDSWRLSSGIVRHDFDGDYWYFFGTSGSCYRCHVDNCRMNSVMADTYEQLKHLYEVESVEDQSWVKEGWEW
jgi:hypothetical protein